MQEKAASTQLLASLSLKSEGEFSLLLKQSAQDPTLFFIANTDQSMSVIQVQKSQTGFLLQEKISFSQESKHSQKIEDACFHSLSRGTEVYSILLTVSEDASLRVWDLESGECVKIFTAQNSLYSVAARESIVLCGSYQKIFTWNLIKMKEGNNFKDHSDDVTGLAFADSFSPKYVLSCSEDELLCLRDLSLPRNDALLVTMPCQVPLLDCGFIDEQGIEEQRGLVWAVSTTNSILIFDLDTCQKLKEISAEELHPGSYCIGGVQKIENYFFFILGSKEDAKLYIYELRREKESSFYCVLKGWIYCGEEQGIRNALCLNSQGLCLITTESGKIQLYQGGDAIATQGGETSQTQEEVKELEMPTVSLQPSVQEDFLIIDDEEVAEEGPEKKKYKLGGLRGYKPY